MPLIEDGIGYDEFYQVVNKESVINESELMEAFQAIDVNRDGFISFNELYATLTKVKSYSLVNVRDDPI
jgi:Ca2+-binding EF-hand superfamily protein